MEAVCEDKYAFSKFYEDVNFTLNYRDTITNNMKNEEEFVSYCLHKIFQDKAFQGKRLIDIGSGPTVHKLAAASAYFSEIILSDYSQHNRKEIQKWLRNESSGINWDSLFQQEAILEGYRDVEEGINEIKLRLRQKIKNVIHCDVLQKEILPINIGKFDILFTSYCLEAACISLESFDSVIKNLSNYILPNGGLVMATVLGCPQYQIEGYDKTISSLSIDPEFVNNTIKEAGFIIKHSYLMENHEENPCGKFNGILVLSATKFI